MLRKDSVRFCIMCTAFVHLDRNTNHISSVACVCGWGEGEGGGRGRGRGGGGGGGGMVLGVLANM